MGERYFDEQSAQRISRSVLHTEGQVRKGDTNSRRGAPRQAIGLWGKTDSSVSKGGTVTVSIYVGDTDSGEDKTAKSRMGDVGSNKWVYIVLDAAGDEPIWNIVSAECD